MTITVDGKRCQLLGTFIVQVIHSGRYVTMGTVVLDDKIVTMQIDGCVFNP